MDVDSISSFFMFLVDEFHWTLKKHIHHRYKTISMSKPRNLRVSFKQMFQWISSTKNIQRRYLVGGERNMSGLFLQLCSWEESSQLTNSYFSDGLVYQQPLIIMDSSGLMVVNKIVNDDC